MNLSNFDAALNDLNRLYTYKYTHMYAHIYVWEHIYVIIIGRTGS